MAHPKAGAAPRLHARKYEIVCILALLQDIDVFAGLWHMRLCVFVCVNTFQWVVPWFVMYRCVSLEAGVALSGHGSAKQSNVWNVIESKSPLMVLPPPHLRAPYLPSHSHDLYSRSSARSMHSSSLERRTGLYLAESA